jgi:hypothetical protein
MIFPCTEEQSRYPMLTPSKDCLLALSSESVTLKLIY